MNEKSELNKNAGESVESIAQHIDSAADTGDKKVNDLASVKPLEKEINGPKGLEPTRYGDWESKGRCYDF